MIEILQVQYKLDMAKYGIWQVIFNTLAANSDNEWLMIDSTIVRAHQSPDVKKKARKRVFLECLNMKRNN
jgi:hypothetical protein